jgi:hypothetical protein
MAPVLMFDFPLKIPPGAKVVGMSWSQIVASGPVSDDRVDVLNQFHQLIPISEI